VETVETVLSSFYLYIAHDLNRGLCKLPAKNGFNHLNEAKIFQTRLPCPSPREKDFELRLYIIGKVIK
jgi:hypothetical protein